MTSADEEVRQIYKAREGRRRVAEFLEDRLEARLIRAYSHAQTDAF